MELIWFVVFTLLLAGYFALEGFDLGVGLLMPVIGRTQETRDRMVAAMAPFVLANEVWLVAVAGALFGVYPSLEGEVLFGLYPMVVAMLLSWVVRDAGLWFRRRIGGAGWRRFWDLMIMLGSLGLSFGWGVTLYAVATGFGSSLLHPVGLLLGVVVTLLFAWHGWTFLGWRAPETAGITRSGRALALSGLAAAVPVLAVLAACLPYLLDHSAPSSTLGVMGLMILPFAPVMVGAQVWVWRVFRPGRGAVPAPSFF
ncbi:cytochrome d ubiquinol oxidase subunit II [Nonomuraea sp. NPDC050383]|uniref:cytochrome d ubiquinol oxidase subunit II n=1 Tax=Nonomuraea sp. NPDC050383 TaxID=3364362 RepID=UPI00379ACA91